jgi:hypothetical protein
MELGKKLTNEKVYFVFVFVETLIDKNKRIVINNNNDNKKHWILRNKKKKFFLPSTPFIC